MTESATQLTTLEAKLESAFGSLAQDKQSELLQDLKGIREALFNDLTAFKSGAVATTTSAGASSSLKEENAALKEENARLAYRVETLTRNMRALLEKSELSDALKEKEKLQYNINHLRAVVKEKLN